MYSEEFDFVSSLDNGLKRKLIELKTQVKRKATSTRHTNSKKARSFQDIVPPVLIQEDVAPSLDVLSEDKLDILSSDKKVEITSKKPNKRGRKKKHIEIQKQPYDWEITYDNDSLPQIRYPTSHAVPNHLYKEFTKNKHLMIPEKPDKKSGRYPLEPSRLLTGREKDHMDWMKKFWTIDRLNFIVEIFVPQHSQDTEITLSLIDWLCIGYAKVLNITYPTETDQDFNLYISYKQNLNAFFRPYFDVFCRGPRLLLEYMDDECSINVKNPNTVEIEWDTKKQVGVRMVNGHKMVYLVTSIGQLMFFRWAEKNDVIEYCKEHAKEIRKHYDENHNKPSPKNGKRRKLTENPNRSWFIKKVSLILDYDFLDAPCVNDIQTDPRDTQQNQPVQDQKKEDTSDNTSLQTLESFTDDVDNIETDDTENTDTDMNDDSTYIEDTNDEIDDNTEEYEQDIPEDWISSSTNPDVLTRV